MIRTLIEKRRLKKLKIRILNGIDTDIEDLLNDLTKEDISEKDALLTVEQLMSLVVYKKNIKKDM